MDVARVHLDRSRTNPDADERKGSSWICGATGSQDAAPSGCEGSAEDLRLRTGAPTSHKCSRSAAGPLRGVRRTLRLVVSQLRVALWRPARLLLQRSALKSTFASLDDLEILSTIGTGAFGVVKLVRHKATGDHFALKMHLKSEIARLHQAMHVRSERSILAELNHPFIIRLHATYQDPHYVYMLLDFASGGDFFSHLRAKRRFSPATVRHYMGCIILALKYMHSRGVVHRDLKPENLLMDDRGRIKLADFGVAKKITDRTWTICGTPEYLAPEIILNLGHNKGVDWWAVGALIYEFLAGYPPFFHDNTFIVYEKILHGRVKFPAFFTAAAKDLISRLLQADLSKRYGCMENGEEDIMNHAFFTEIDFAALEDGSAPAPLLPTVTHPGDTCNFDHFPEDTSPKRTAITAEAQKLFAEF